MSKKGTITSETTIVDKPTKELVKERKESRTLDPAPSTARGTVTAEHNVAMSNNFQSVSTRVAVTLPTETDEESVYHTFAQAWDIVEQEHEARAEWVADVLRTLVEARSKK